jgi:hypothetical protein
MKNPFAMMAMMAAAMSLAFRENAYRNAGLSLPMKARGSRGPAGKPNPAGAKLVMGFYKAKHGRKAESLEEARDWYRSYLAEQDAKARQIEATRKAACGIRRTPCPPTCT